MRGLASALRLGRLSSPKLTHRDRPGPLSTRKASSTLALFGSSLLLVALFIPASATPAFAATNTKVVIVVGPTGSLTPTLITDANTAASVARKYTSNVTTIYTPHATWSKVSAAAQGANILIYMGHGNGFPSPYSATLNPSSMDGMGLNPYDGSGDSAHTYYGEATIASTIKLAPNAIVLLNHLCYASGNNEWGAGIPSLSTAKQRADNFAAGFIRSGAKAVVADAIGDISWYVGQLFTRHSTVDSMFKAAPNKHGNYTTYASTRSAGYTAVLDVGTYSWVPDGDPYQRSMVSVPSTPTDSMIGSAASTAPAPSGTLVGKTAYDAVNLRQSASATAAIVKTLPVGTAFAVTGSITADSTGRTWASVKTSTGLSGYISTAYAYFSGSAKATAPVNLRSGPKTTASIILVVASGTRFTVTGSWGDSAFRTWFAVKLSTGKTGYLASWYTAP